MEQSREQEVIITIPKTMMPLLDPYPLSGIAKQVSSVEEGTRDFNWVYTGTDI